MPGPRTVQWRRLNSYCVSQGVEPAGHWVTVKVGSQKLSGQKRTEMKY